MANFMTNESKECTNAIFISSTINRFFDYNRKPTILIGGTLRHCLWWQLVIVNDDIVAIREDIF